MYVAVKIPLIVGLLRAVTPGLPMWLGVHFNKLQTNVSGAYGIYNYYIVYNSKYSPCTTANR